MTPSPCLLQPSDLPILTLLGRLLLPHVLQLASSPDKVLSYIHDDFFQVRNVVKVFLLENVDVSF
jgi:hypothetical protein